MELRAMRYVAAIAEYENLTRAAEALHIGQPTLSKFLVSLENELELKLFRKVGNRFVLTDAGERYIKKASRILLLEEDLAAEMRDIRKEEIGSVKAAFANMRASYMLPLILPVFREMYPKVEVQLFEGSSDENDRRLLTGQVEAAFYSMPALPNPQIEYRPLAKEELLICTCKDHPLSRLARKTDKSPWPALDLSAIGADRVIMMQPGQRTRQIVDSLLARRAIRYDNVLYMGNIPAIMGLVAAGYGISFIFETHLRNWHGDAPIDCYSIAQGPVIGDFVAAVRKGAYLSRYSEAFIELTKRITAEGAGSAD